MAAGARCKHRRCQPANSCLAVPQGLLADLRGYQLNAAQSSTPKVLLFLLSLLMLLLLLDWLELLPCVVDGCLQARLCHQPHVQNVLTACCLGLTGSCCIAYSGCFGASWPDRHSLEQPLTCALVAMSVEPQCFTTLSHGASSQMLKSLIRHSTSCCFCLHRPASLCRQHKACVWVCCPCHVCTEALYKYGLTRVRDTVQVLLLTCLVY